MPIPFIFNSDNTFKYKNVQRMRLPKALFPLFRINDTAWYIFFPLNLLSKNLDWKIETHKPFLPFHDEGEGWEEVLENEMKEERKLNSDQLPGISTFPLLLHSASGIIVFS